MKSNNFVIDFIKIRSILSRSQREIYFEVTFNILDNLVITYQNKTLGNIGFQLILEWL